MPKAIAERKPANTRIVGCFSFLERRPAKTNHDDVGVCVHGLVQALNRAGNPISIGGRELAESAGGVAKHEPKASPGPLSHASSFFHRIDSSSMTALTSIGHLFRI
jgi:hypothetical protein